MRSAKETTPVEAYFVALDAGEVEVALATLSESCIYARPPLLSEDGRTPTLMEALVGKPAVRAFLERRGRLALVHDVHSVITDGRWCCVEGAARYLDGRPVPPSIFVAHAEIDDDGLISRFLALSATVDAATAGLLAQPGRSR